MLRAAAAWQLHGQGRWCCINGNRKVRQCMAAVMDLHACPRSACAAVDLQLVWRAGNCIHCTCLYSVSLQRAADGGLLYAPLCMLQGRRLSV